MGIADQFKDKAQDLADQAKQKAGQGKDEAQERGSKGRDRNRDQQQHGSDQEQHHRSGLHDLRGQQRRRLPEGDGDGGLHREGQADAEPHQQGAVGPRLFAFFRC